LKVTVDVFYFGVSEKKSVSHKSCSFLVDEDDEEVDGWMDMKKKITDKQTNKQKYPWMRAWDMRGFA